MKQTAIEWFAQKLSEQGIDYPLQELQQAKAMEKEQIEKAFEEGMFHHTNGLCPDEYYEETYKIEEL